MFMSAYEREWYWGWLGTGIFPSTIPIRNSILVGGKTERGVVVSDRDHGCEDHRFAECGVKEKNFGKKLKVSCLNKFEGPCWTKIPNLCLISEIL
jgi:hypothetical protein